MAPGRRRPRAGARGAVPGTARDGMRTLSEDESRRARSRRGHRSSFPESPRGKSPRAFRPVRGREWHRTRARAAHRATRQRRRRRRGARNTSRGELHGRHVGRASREDTSSPHQIAERQTQRGRRCNRDGALRGDGRGTPDALLRGRVQRIDAVRDARRSASRARGRPARERRGGWKRARGRLPERGRRRDATSKTTRQGRKPPASQPPHQHPLQPDHPARVRPVTPLFPTPPRPLSADLAPPPSRRTIQQHRSFVTPRPAAHQTLAFPSLSSQLRKAHERSKFAPELERLPGHGRADPPRHPRHRAERPPPARRRRRRQRRRGPPLARRPRARFQTIRRRGRPRQGVPLHSRVAPATGARYPRSIERISRGAGPRGVSGPHGGSARSARVRPRREGRREVGTRARQRSLQRRGRIAPKSRGRAQRTR